MAQVEPNRNLAGMLDRIVQRLLGNAQDPELLVGRQPVALIDACLDGRPVDPAEPLDMIVQSGREAIALEAFGTEREDQAAHFIERAGRLLLDLRHMLGGCRGIGLQLVRRGACLVDQAE